MRPTSPRKDQPDSRSSRLLRRRPRESPARARGSLPGRGHRPYLQVFRSRGAEGHPDVTSSIAGFEQALGRALDQCRACVRPARACSVTMQRRSDSNGSSAMRGDSLLQRLALWKPAAIAPCNSATSVGSPLNCLSVTAPRRYRAPAPVRRDCRNRSERDVFDALVAVCHRSR